MNSTQDSHQSSAPAMQGPPGSEPDGSVTRTSDSQPVLGDLPLPDGPRDLGSLAFGVGLFFAACIVFWLGLYLPNHVALRAVAASFGTFGLVWLLFRLRVFHRPRGGLIAVGAVALFAAVVPFVERGFQKLDRVAKAGLAGETDDVSKEGARGVTPPVPAPAVQPPEQKPVAPLVDEVVRELIAPAPDPTSGRLIRLTQDAQVTIGGRKFLIRAGSQFPFKSFSEGHVTFLAGGQEVTIDSELVAFTGQSQETPAEITKLAMDELKKRYPKIFEKGTPENDVFVERTKELKVELPDFFANPRWPLEVGEQLAAQEGWKRADKPEEDVPQKPSTEPAEPIEPADPVAPKEPAPPATPQMAPK